MREPRQPECAEPQLRPPPKYELPPLPGAEELTVQMVQMQLAQLSEAAFDAALGEGRR